MEDLYDPEEKILCPYNSAHHIRRCKMSFHLVKCKKNYGEQRMVPCDFNATHIVPEPELRYHHQTCSDRKKIEPQIRESMFTKRESKFPIVNFNVDEGECWDDVNEASYNPNQYVENNEILRHLDVESGAKRKNFRLNERQRLANIVGQSSNNERPPESRQVPKMEPTVKQLPPHRNITEPPEERFNASAFREKLKLENSKLYLQYRPQN